MTILYGESRNGKRCDDCVYCEKELTRGLVCVLEDKKTQAYMCCGLWLKNHEPVEVDDKQGELF